MSALDIGFDAWCSLVCLVGGGVLGMILEGRWWRRRITRAMAGLSRTGRSAEAAALVLALLGRRGLEALEYRLANEKPIDVKIQARDEMSDALKRAGAAVEDARAEIRRHR